MTDESHTADQINIYVDGEKVAVCESVTIDRLQERITDLTTGEVEQPGIINIIGESEVKND